MKLIFVYVNADCDTTKEDRKMEPKREHGKAVTEVSRSCDCRWVWVLVHRICQL